MKIRSVCVYCGSQNGANPAHREAASTIGANLATAGIRLVYGGGTKGLMGAVAKATLENGGEVTGVIPNFLLQKEADGKIPDQLSEVIVTADMHERKHMMYERADAFVALPGGIGTLEEVIEIMTWAQLGRHTKPVCLANVDGFWEPLLGLIGRMREAGFIHTANRVRPLVVDDPREIVAAILADATRIADPSGERAIIDRL